MVQDKLVTWVITTVSGQHLLASEINDEMINDLPNDEGYWMKSMIWRKQV